MNKISIFSQDFEAHLNNTNIPWFQAEWEKIPRKKTLEYMTELSGGAAAEEAFRLLNIPPEELEPDEREKIKDFRGPSLSVGDIVEIQTPAGTTQMLCANTGWLARTLEKAPEKTPEKENQSEEIPPLTLHGETVRIEATLYRSGQTALQLVCEDGSPYATPSVNLPEEDAAPNEVFIKNYSENQGVVDALVRAGIGEKTGEILLPPYGVEVAILKITHDKLLEKLESLKKTLAEKASKKPNTATPESPNI